MEPLVIERQPGGHLPTQIGAQRLHRVAVRQAFQRLQHHHRGDLIGRHRRPAPTRAEQIGEQLVREQARRCSAKNAYTDPAGTRCPTNAAASNNSRFGSDEPCTPTILFDPHPNASTLTQIAQQPPRLFKWRDCQIPGVTGLA